MRTRLIFGFVAFASVVGVANPAIAQSRPATAAATRPAAGAVRIRTAIANRYARQHNLPTRVVRLGTAARPVERVFVPITNQEQLDSFQTHFGPEAGGVTLRYNEAQQRHLSMVVHPGDNYFWARNYNGSVNGIPDYRYLYSKFEGGGHTIALNLGNKGVTHLQGWLTERAQPSDPLYRAGRCMDWLPNAEVEPGKALFHHLGVNRSIDGGNMKAKLIHAGNARVDVVGIHVNSVAEFNGMTDEQLAGKIPAGGVEEAARD